MRLDIPELERLSAEERQHVLVGAIRSVVASHGRMSNVPHYVGCALTVAIVGMLVIKGRGAFVAVLAGVPAYFGSLLVGIVLWRRSKLRQLRKVVHEAIVARTRA